ncbi:hypothetical protein MMC22_006258 [Lobaria immixta]|nr:hypothetical protein [Lobaria immixta]
MSSSELSDLSSALSSEDENVVEALSGAGKLDHYFQKGSVVREQASPPAKRKRPASPPHEYVLADNPDIAVICMFRSRFGDAFPKSLPHYGPQDIERGVEELTPGEQVEKLLCALLGLVLNRKKDVERGHFQRALEEAVQTHTSQWPSIWNGKNPLHGGGNFGKMSAAERLALLKALVLWSLSSSEAIQAIIKESFKQQRHDDDLNQPLSVQPWGRDGDKRRYWLIEGQDDTHFRLYRESNPVLKHNTWRNVAGSIDELKDVATHLGEEGTQASRRLRDRITQAVPRFEASEEKRKRRDYRNARKAQFTRPEPGFSLYEGRTRGKRHKYTFSDEEEGASDAPSTRRSNRQSGLSTPAEPAGPTFTASGRQVRSRVGGAYGESVLSGQLETAEAPAINDANGGDVAEEEPVSRGRTRGSALRNRVTQKVRSRKHIEGYNALDEMEDESDASSSGGDWEGADEDEVDANISEDEDDEDADMSDDEASIANEDDVEEDRNKKSSDRPGSLVVALRYQKKDTPPPTTAQPRAFSKESTNQLQSRKSSPDINAGVSMTKTESRTGPSVYNKPTGLSKFASTDPTQRVYSQKNPENPSGPTHNHFSRPVEDHLVGIS